MSKSEELAALAALMAANTELPLTSQANLVFGEGSPECEVMFIGEAPGEREDIERRPFVGRGGQLLRECIRALGWKEADVYISNIVKRRPPGNRDPLPEEIAAYQPYLTQQIEIIAPRVIVPLGRFSMNYFLPEAKITRDQGRVFHIEGPARPDEFGHSGKRIIIPMLHPAAALRAPEMMRAFRETFAKLPELIRGGGGVELPPAYADTPAPKNAGTPPGPKQGGLF